MTVLLILQRWNRIGEPMDDGVAQLARQLMESGLASLGAHERHVIPARTSFDPLAPAAKGRPSRVGTRSRLVRTGIIALVAKRLHAAQDVNCLVETRQTAGERLADKVAKLGGSWAFIIVFTAMLAGWAVLNTAVLAHYGGGFDSYPYIFLNLILSMVAALQAPVILMSQNGQAARDRVAAALDYEINLKAEVEIMALHDKLDRIRLDHLEAMIQGLSQQIADAGKPG